VNVRNNAVKGPSRAICQRARYRYLCSDLARATHAVWKAESLRFLQLPARAYAGAMALVSGHATGDYVLPAVPFL
jgi:hypothetical protein